MATLIGGAGNTGTTGRGVADSVLLTSASFSNLSPEPPDYYQSNNISVRKTYFSYALPFAAPDLEVVDANRDGVLDLYIVQNDERKRERNGSLRAKGYCSSPIHRYRDWFTGPRTEQTPPANYTPPLDRAPDLLFLGRRRGTRTRRFKLVTMKHKEPGCGYFVKKFGNHSLVLAQGGPERHGHQLFLQW